MATIAHKIQTSVKKSRVPTLFGLSAMFGAMAAGSTGAAIVIGVQIPAPHPVTEAVLLSAFTAAFAGAALACGYAAYRNFHFARLLQCRAQRHASPIAKCL